MKGCFLVAVLLLLPAVNAVAQKQKITSIYTDLTAQKCKTLELNEAEAGYYRAVCKGVGGYKLESIEGDLRQTVNVIAPNKKKFELDFGGKVSGAFSSIGNKAEWRVVTKNGKLTPVALIIRFNASENPDHPDQTTSYLIVSKIERNEICITDIVKPSPNANNYAQKLADDAVNKRCKALNN